MACEWLWSLPKELLSQYGNISGREERQLLICQPVPGVWAMKIFIAIALCRYADELIHIFNCIIEPMDMKSNVCDCCHSSLGNPVLRVFSHDAALGNVQCVWSMASSLSSGLLWGWCLQSVLNAWKVIRSASRGAKGLYCIRDWNEMN